MYDMYASDLSIEQCAPDKSEIDVIIPCAVIHFVLSGEGFVNGQRLQKNTVFIAYSDCRMDYYPSKEDPWCYIYARLRGDDVEAAFLDHGFNLGLTVFPFDKTEDLLAIMDFYRQFEHLENSAIDKMVANLLFLLFDRKDDPNTRKNQALQHIEQIKQYIEENYYRHITMEGISSKFYLNKNYIRTLFSQYLGISPKQYIQKLRMQRAEFLLFSTDESISVVASSVGYNDALLFSKMFKRFYGISPTKYREESRK